MNFLTYAGACLRFKCSWFSCRFIAIAALVLSSFAALSQGVLDIPAKPENGKPLVTLLEELEQRELVRFFYLPEWLDPFTIHEGMESMTIKEVLRNLLQDSDIDFALLYDYAVVFYKNPEHEAERKRLIAEALADRKPVDLVQIGSRKEYVLGKLLKITGQVKDEERGQPLVGATVQVSGINKLTTTDVNGRYSMTLPGGEYVISHHYINHQEKLINLAIYQDANLTVELGEVAITLEEIVVSDAPISTRRIGESSIKMIEVKRVPSLLGQPDLIRQVQTQAGVTAVSEASPGFNVRGGGTDQNLILYDGVPIFNSSHALGFFTAFNSDAIHESTFYKGGIPAEYGGRVSSVLNLSSRDGGYEKWSGTGNVGVVSSSLAIGGPVKKDTSSLFASFRASYSDWILNILKTRYQNIENGSVFFYDGSLRYSHRLDKNSKLTVSTYTSQDKFRLANDTTYHSQNIAASIRYDHSVSDNFYYNAGLYFGRYTYRVSDEEPDHAYDLNYKITYPSLKVDFNHLFTRHAISFGLHSTYYHFSPGDLIPTSPVSTIKETHMPAETALESAIYIGDAFNLKPNVLIEGGIRFSFFNRFGPGKVYLYKPDASKEVENTTDSIMYSSGEIMKSYFGPEPRLSVRYSIDQSSSIKLGYNRIYQYVHLVSNTASITPVDIWQLSNVYYKPQIADQVSIGYFRNSRDNTYEFSVEGFYKEIQNILDFKDGANLILNSQLETALLPGMGTAYGVELSVSKMKGRLVGALNYTYSRSFRKVDGTYDTEKINGGQKYPSNYDQPNVVNLNWRYKVTRRIFFTGAFTYRTGRPVSLPVSGYILENVPVSNFEARNNYRIPDYHRLDLALVVEGSNRKNKRIEGTWVFSIYNVYGRKNPYSVYMVDTGAGTLKPYQLSLIGTAVPSISYSFKF